MATTTTAFRPQPGSLIYRPIDCPNPWLPEFVLWFLDLGKPNIKEEEPPEIEYDPQKEYEQEQAQYQEESEEYSSDVYVADDEDSDENDYY